MISTNNKEKKVKQELTRVKLNRTVTQHTYTKKMAITNKILFMFSRKWDDIFYYNYFFLPKLNTKKPPKNKVNLQEDELSREFISTTIDVQN